MPKYMKTKFVRGEKKEEKQALVLMSLGTDKSVAYAG